MESKAEKTIVQDTIKYTIYKNPDGKSILCKRCKVESHHPLDVEYRYCANCRMFIATLAEMLSR